MVEPEAETDAAAQVQEAEAEKEEDEEIRAAEAAAKAKGTFGLILDRQAETAGKINLGKVRTKIKGKGKGAAGLLLIQAAAGRGLAPAQMFVQARRARESAQGKISAEEAMKIRAKTGAALPSRRAKVSDAPLKGWVETADGRAPPDPDVAHAAKAEDDADADVEKAADDFMREFEEEARRRQAIEATPELAPEATPEARRRAAVRRRPSPTASPTPSDPEDCGPGKRRATGAASRSSPSASPRASPERGAPEEAPEAAEVEGKGKAPRHRSDLDFEQQLVQGKVEALNMSGIWPGAHPIDEATLRALLAIDASAAMECLQETEDRASGGQKMDPSEFLQQLSRRNPEEDKFFIMEGTLKS